MQHMSKKCEVLYHQYSVVSFFKKTTDENSQQEKKILAVQIFGYAHRSLQKRLLGRVHFSLPQQLQICLLIGEITRVIGMSILITAEGKKCLTDTGCKEDL